MGKRGKQSNTKKIVLLSVLAGILLLLIAVAVTVLVVYNEFRNDVEGNDTDTDLVTIEIERGDSTKKIAEKLEAGVLKDAVLRILAQGNAARPEKEFDSAVYRLVNRERYVPFGVHVPAVFLLNREAELKNCRIIAAGLEAGLSGAALRERIRVDYV